MPVPCRQCVSFPKKELQHSWGSRDPQPESGENASLSRPHPELPSLSQNTEMPSLELFVFSSTVFIETSIYFSDGILKDGRGPWRP